MRTYQDTLRNEGDSAVHRSVGNVHIVGHKAKLSILLAFETKLEILDLRLRDT